MLYRRLPSFNKSFKPLPKEVKEKAAKAFKLFQKNPRHRSLDVKKIRGLKGIWEGRIDDFYRFTFEYGKDEKTGEPTCYFRNIGRHDIIDHAP